MSKANQIHEIGALQLAEKAVHLLRLHGGVFLGAYYIGSLPYVIGLLYFWSDMSRNPAAAWYCAPAAAGMALLFVWMKYWQVRYCRGLLGLLQESSDEHWPFRRSLITAARQTAVHATGVVILPLSLILAFPLGWTYAFYQNICVLDEPHTRSAFGIGQAAAEQARLWPGQNHLFLFFISLFALIVFVNLGVAVAMLPYLLKSLLGVETVFTLSGTGLLNTTFLAVLCALTYLCVDPIIKAAYVLRCFYGRSRRTGEDIRAGLKPYLSLVLFVTAFSLCNGHDVHAASSRTTQPNSEQTTAYLRDDAHALNHAIEQVLQQRRFAWRLPGEKTVEAPADESWLTTAFKWVGDGVKYLTKPVWRWIKKFLDWLEELLPDPDSGQAGQSDSLRTVLRLFLYLAGFALLALVVIVLRRWWIGRRRQAAPSTPSIRQQAVDIDDEKVTADDLSTDRWLAMADDLINRKAFRQAVRALYLAVLAVLSDANRVAVARYKSNQDYCHELERRAHAEPELLPIFRSCVNLFERVWYGLHPVQHRYLDELQTAQKRIAALVRNA